LKYCPRSSLKNRQRILISLISVKMCLGFMPSTKIRDEYKLTELYNLGEATIRGDVRTFEKILLDNQKSFIRLGIYLVLVHVKTIAYRNLFKRIMNIVNRTTTNTGRLNLQICETVFNGLNEDVDLDEIGYYHYYYYYYHYYYYYYYHHHHHHHYYYY